MTRTPAPDVTIRLADVPPIIRRIAAAMIARHGSYTYTEHPSGRKVKVIA